MQSLSWIILAYCHLSFHIRVMFRFRCFPHSTGPTDDFTYPGLQQLAPVSPARDRSLSFSVLENLELHEGARHQIPGVCLQTQRNWNARAGQQIKCLHFVGAIFYNKKNMCGIRLAYANILENSGAEMVKDTASFCIFIHIYMCLCVTHNKTIEESPM